MPRQESTCRRSKFAQRRRPAEQRQLRRSTGFEHLEERTLFAGLQLLSADTYGGSGHQFAMAATVTDQTLHVGGRQTSPPQAIARGYDLQSGALPVFARESSWPPTASSSAPPSSETFRAAAPSGDGSQVLYVGTSYSLTSDGVGGKEPKSVIAAFAADGTAGPDLGGAAWLKTPNFFPYRGYESFETVATHPNGAIVAAGLGEETGFGGGRAILAAFTEDGSVMWKRKFGTAPDGSPTTNTGLRIESGARDVAWLGDDLYVAGFDRDASRLGGAARQGMLLRVDAAAQALDPNPNNDQSTALSPVWERVAGARSDFFGIDTLGDSLIVVGNSGAVGDGDYLAQRYDSQGNLLWTMSTGSALDETLSSVRVHQGRVFAAGSFITTSGDRDIVLLELDPQDGAVLQTLTYGGSGDEYADDLTSHDTRLFLAGFGNSPAAGGNGPGEFEAVLLTIDAGTVNEPPVLGEVQWSSNVIQEGSMVSASAAIADEDFDQRSYSGTALWSDGAVTPIEFDRDAGLAKTTRFFADDDPTGTPADAFSVTLRVQDDLGQEAVTSSAADLIVENVPPTLAGLQLDSAAKLLPNEALTLSASFTDPGVLDTHTATVDWGDGTTSSIQHQPGSGLQAAHAYQHAGVYQVQVELFDDDGGSDTAMLYIAVSGISVVDGQLRIVGSDDNDVISVHRVGDGLVASIASLALSQVSEVSSTVDSIRIWGCAGDDQIHVGQPLTLPAVVDGGEGDDHIRTGSGHDHVIDASGNNHIHTGKGNDLIETGPGNDFIHAGGGDDVVIAGNGQNHVLAGAGNDTVTGGDNYDWVYAGSGNDLVFGGAGGDILLLGSGNDVAFGEAGDDVILAGEGSDLVIGGAGRDILLGDAVNDLLLSEATSADDDLPTLLAVAQAWWADEPTDRRKTTVLELFALIDDRQFDWVW